MSGSQASADATSGLRQRSCNRVTCKATLSIGEKPSGNCCDDSCLVEVARRECNNECGHDPVDFEKSSQPRDSVADRDIALSIKSDNQPCARHYKKTRDQYGAVLDNLGCICKVLLSLNIESCCVIPSHASIRSKRSATSKLSKPATEATVATVGDCSKMSCCSKSASKPVSPTKDSQADDCSKKTCCINELSASSSSSKRNTEAQLASAASTCNKDVALAPTTVPVAGTDDIDMEKGLFQVEHLVLNVQGMTCTGCEKKLYRSLDALPAISNVKTSLVLAQAEFDLSGS
ncbi:hypothetical protein F5882DRAFT_331912, partial [Hyaloscypha sp. PMI_1271]